MSGTDGPLFDEEISDAYAKYRPFYPQKVAEIITSFMKSHGSSGVDIAVDVACGPGQSTFLLCDSFHKVIGIDISQHQIKQANQMCAKFGKENVQFIVGDAHKIPLESSSVDLLTIAMGWQWLDAEQFYAEAKRVLKPGGCIAVYGHGVQMFDNKRVNDVFEAYRQEMIKSKCFDEHKVQHMHVLNKYESVELPFLHTKRCEFEFPQQLTIDQLLGIISSVVMYKRYCEKFPENNLLEEIRATYEANNTKVDVETVMFPGFIILGINE